MKYLLVTFLIFITIAAVAEEQRVKVSPRKGSETLTAGDFSTLRLTFWPVPEGREKSIIALEGKELFNGLHLLEIVWSERNNNNVDVFELEGRVVYKPSDKTVETSLLNIDSGSYRIIFENLSLNNIKKSEATEYQWLEQGLPLAVNRKYLLVLVGALLMLIIVFRKYQKKKKERLLDKEKKRKLKEKMEFYASIFERANERAHFEKIVTTKDEWLPLVGKKTADIDEFVQKIKEIQYQREWSESDLLLVRTIFEKIRNILSAVRINGI